MLVKFKQFFLITVLISLLTGCIKPEEKMQEFLETDSATQVRQDYKNILESLVLFKTKLDRRNPNEFDKKLSNQIFQEIRSNQNNIKININNTPLIKYDDYFKFAFDKNSKLKNRNDFLILGIYKLIYEAYDLKKGHQITALTYNNEKLQKLHYYLQALKWRIKTAKNDNKEYLFLTWQKNWQIELERKINAGELPSWKMIENLKYIKEKKESIFESSNFSFEIILSRMIFDVKNTLKNIGEEPLDMGIEALKGLVFFI